MFPNASLVGSDTIDFGGTLSDFDGGAPVGRVDVGRSFDPSNNSGGAWVWQDLQNTQAPGAAPSMGPSADWRVTQPTGNQSPNGGGNTTAPPTGSGDLSVRDLANQEAGFTGPDGRPTNPITDGGIDTGMGAMGPNDMYLGELASARRKRIGSAAFGRF